MSENTDNPEMHFSKCQPLATGARGLPRCRLRRRKQWNTGPTGFHCVSGSSFRAKARGPATFSHSEQTDHCDPVLEKLWKHNSQWHTFYNGFLSLYDQTQVHWFSRKIPRDQRLLSTLASCRKHGGKRHRGHSLEASPGWLPTGWLPTFSALRPHTAAALVQLCQPGWGHQKLQGCHCDSAFVISPNHQIPGLAEGKWVRGPDHNSVPCGWTAARGEGWRVGSWRTAGKGANSRQEAVRPRAAACGACRWQLCVRAGWESRSEAFSPRGRDDLQLCTAINIKQTSCLGHCTIYRSTKALGYTWNESSVICHSYLN